MSVAQRKLSRDLVRAETDKDMLEKERVHLIARTKELTRERDVLTNLIQQFDSKLKGMQSNIKSLAHDRDKTQALYTQVVKELKSRTEQEKHYLKERQEQLSVIAQLKQLNAEYATDSKESGSLRQVTERRLEEAYANISQLQGDKEDLVAQLEVHISLYIYIYISSSSSRTSCVFIFINSSFDIYIYIYEYAG